MAIIKRKKKEEAKIYDIGDYASTFFEPINKVPLNELDFAIFSKMAYYNFQVLLPRFSSSLYLKDFYNLEKLKDLLGGNFEISKEKSLALKVFGNPRYKDLKVKWFKERIRKKNTEQFDAVTFYNNEIAVIIFRGTDARYYSWKEDFNMAYKLPVPSQVTAIKYVEYITAKLKGRKFYLTGHSKGGNLALYAYYASSDEVKNKIEAIYAYDAPGIETYTPLDLKNEGIFKKYIPNQSIIGMIFDTTEATNIVQSQQTLIAQHDLFNWKVDLKHRKFICTKDLDNRIKNFNIQFKNYLASKTMEEREMNLDLVFKLLKAVGINDKDEFEFNFTKSIGMIRKEYKKLDPKNKDKVVQLVKDIIRLLFSKPKPNKS